MNQTASLTEAQRFIRARQTQREGRDYLVAAIYDIVATDMPPWVASMLASGQIALGTLDESYPWAVTEEERDGSIAIGISYGFYDCVYAFARAIAAGITVHAPGKTVDPSVLRQQAITEFRRLFDLFKTGQRVSHQGSFPNAVIDPEQIRIADETARFAEVLVLAHELGHAGQMKGALPSDDTDTETDADRFAAQIILKAGARLGYRVPLSGAFFGFRMYAILERFGYRFNLTHPPVAERMAIFLDEARPHFGTRALMMMKMSMVVAFDVFIESLENEADGKGPMTEQTAIRAGVWLRAMLEEIGRGRLPLTRLADELKTGFKNASSDLMEQVLLAYVEDVKTGAIASMSVPVFPALKSVSADLDGPLQKIIQRLVP